MDWRRVGATIGAVCRMAYNGPSRSFTGLTSIEGSSSSCMLFSAAEGMVVRKRTVNRPGEPGGSDSSCMAHWRVKRGLARNRVGSLDALERDILHVLVLAVVADPLESLRELDKLESCDVFRVTNHEEALRLGSSRRSGIPQWWLCRQESERDELKFSLLETEEARLCCFCWISAIW